MKLVIYVSESKKHRLFLKTSNEELSKSKAVDVTNHRIVPVAAGSNKTKRGGRFCGYADSTQPCRGGMEGRQRCQGERVEIIDTSSDTM